MTNLFEAKQTALDYYNSIKPQNLINGFLRYIAVSGTSCLIVHHPQVASGFYVFRCQTQNDTVMIELEQ